MLMNFEGQDGFFFFFEFVKNVLTFYHSNLWTVVIHTCAVDQLALCAFAVVSVP